MNIEKELKKYKNMKCFDDIKLFYQMLSGDLTKFKKGYKKNNFSISEALLQKDLEKRLKKYEDMKCFDKNQMREIRNGLKDGLDVSWYTNPKFSWYQMRIIYWGLDDGLDVSKYAKPEYNENQMLQIFNSLKTLKHNIKNP